MTKTGLNHFRSLFPAKFTKDQLANMDEDGVIKVGFINKPCAGSKPVVSKTWRMTCAPSCAWPWGRP